MSVYLDKCVAALRSNNPIAWPAYQDNPVSTWRYIARNIGHGLTLDNETEQEIKGLYTRIVVVSEFSSKNGVTINAKEFFGWIREAATENHSTAGFGKEPCPFRSLIDREGKQDEQSTTTDETSDRIRPEENRNGGDVFGLCGGRATGRACADGQADVAD